MYQTFIKQKKTIFPDNEAHIVYSLIQMENDSDSLFWNVTAAADAWQVEGVKGRSLSWYVLSTPD